MACVRKTLKPYTTTQTARFLVKALLAARRGAAPTGGAAYLADAEAEVGRRCGVRSAEDWLSPEAQLAALRSAAAQAC